MTQYLTNAQYRADKARLTRAINTGEPARVIAAVTVTVRAWLKGDYAWPDDWHRWDIALRDARAPFTIDDIFA